MSDTEESAKSESQEHRLPRAGDWIQVASPGAPPRRGLVLETLGEPGHEHYLVRWDEEHESIFYPSDGMRIVRE